MYFVLLLSLPLIKTSFKNLLSIIPRIVSCLKRQLNCCFNIPICVYQFRHPAILPLVRSLVIIKNINSSTLFLVTINYYKEY